jgi:hypothetical protein
MARLITLMRFPKNVRSTCDLPAGFKVEPLGSRAEVVGLIGELFPQADLANGSPISLQSGDSHAEIAIHGDPVEAIGLLDPSRNVIVALCERTGCRAIDAATGDLMSFD